MQWVVRARRQGHDWPVRFFDRPLPAAEFAESVGECGWAQTYVLEVPTWTNNRPDVYPCRVCRQMTMVDVLGRPTSEVYPSPILCSAACRNEHLGYITAGGIRAWQ